MKKLLLLPLVTMIFACGKKENENAIKGLTPYDISENFKNKGLFFEKSITEFGTLNKGVQQYDGITFMVATMGSDHKSVENITADYILDNSRKNIESGEEFLIYTSSLPYDNSNPEAATSWVKKNYNNNNQDTIIGDVKFTILAPSIHARRLVMERSK